MAAQYDYSLLKSAGRDVLISAAVEIRRPQQVTIGNHFAMDAGAYITVAARFGDYVHVGPQVTIIGGAKGELAVGNFCNFAAGARLICVSDTLQGEGLTGPASLPDKRKDPVVAAPIIVEDFVSVGTNAVIMPGVTLGQGCVIGACSLVTKSTEPWTIYAGVPAKPLKKRASEKMFAHARAMGYEIAPR